MEVLNTYRIHHNGKKIKIQAENYHEANKMYIETYLAFNNEVITVHDFKIEFIKGRPFYGMTTMDWEYLINEYDPIHDLLAEEIAS